MRNAIRLMSGLMILAMTGAATPSDAQTFDVPPGFEMLADTTAADDGAWEGVVTVRPEPGVFSGLSAVRLRTLTSDPEDPDAWLRSRMQIDIGAESAARDVLRSPDSPFGDPAFDGLREALPKLFAGLDDLSSMPLDFCDDPKDTYTAAGQAREMFCEFEAGPFRQFFILRLQAVDGRWYFTEIRAMNQRRLRHLEAIANSFRL